MHTQPFQKKDKKEANMTDHVRPFSNAQNVDQAFSRARVLVVRSQTSDGPKYWIAPG